MKKTYSIIVLTMVATATAIFSVAAGPAPAAPTAPPGVSLAYAQPGWIGSSWRWVWGTNEAVEGVRVDNLEDMKDEAYDLLESFGEGDLYLTSMAEMSVSEQTDYLTATRILRAADAYIRIDEDSVEAFLVGDDEVRVLYKVQFPSSQMNRIFQACEIEREVELVRDLTARGNEMVKTVSFTKQADGWKLIQVLE